MEHQAKKQIETLALANNIQEFCQRIQPTLTSLSFDQRRQLVELLIGRVIVNVDKGEIRYVIPTSPNGENTRFCHLRTDYLDLESKAVKVDDLVIGQSKIATKEIDIGKSTCLAVDLGDDDQIERLGKIHVQHFGMVDASLNGAIEAACDQILIRDITVIDLVTILPVRSLADVRTIIWEIQSGVIAQFGNQV